MMTLTYIVSAVILLGLCIFIHELGHLLGGMMVGIKAKVFSLGYGKGFFKKKIGDTTYQVTLIPLGGYCQFYGEEPTEEREGKEYEFLTAPPWKRIITVAMGPIFNLIFGIVLFYFMNLIGYTKETNRVIIPSEYRAGNYISPAYRAGIKNGDIIFEINGKKIKGFSDIQTSVIFSKGNELNVKVNRGDEIIKYRVKPRLSESTGRYSIGVMPYGDMVMIAGLIDDEVAEESGLEQMDVIKSLDGVKMRDTREFTDYIKKHANREILFKIIRSEKEKELKVKPRINTIVSIGETITIDKRIIDNAISKNSIKLDDIPVKDSDVFFSAIKERAKRSVNLEIFEKIFSGKQWM